MQLYSTSQVGVLGGIKSLVYGKSGVGKTRLIATAPHPVIFSAESGLLSLRTYNLPFAEIRTLADLDEAYRWSVQSYEAQQFHTIAMDSASEIAEVVLRNELAKSKDPRKAYGEMASTVFGYVRAFRDIPYKNIVIIAKEEYDKDGTTGMMVFQPMFPGQQIGKNISYFFDEVFQLFVYVDQATRQRHEILRCHSDHQNIAKDRSGALGEYEQANLTAIYNKILATGVR